jgi:hypothetical protein
LLGGKKYCIVPAGDLTERIVTTMTKIGEAYNKTNIFVRRGFDTLDRRYTLLLEIDANKISK